MTEEVTGFCSKHNKEVTIYLAKYTTAVGYMKTEICSNCQPKGPCRDKCRFSDRDKDPTKNYFERER